MGKGDAWSAYSLAVELTLRLDRSSCELDGATIIQFLKWASQSDLFLVPSRRQVSFNEKTHFRVSTTAKLAGRRTPIIGYGRDEDYSLALIKAYAEAVERIVAVECQNELGVAATMDISLDESGMLTIAPSCRPQLMPEETLRTSNGWAVHFSKESAIKLAFLEALERHLLLRSFLKSGWHGFVRGKAIELDGYILESLSSVESICGFQAGMVAAKLRRHSGYAFGYFCDSVRSFGDSARWLHAMLEALEPAKIYDNFSAPELIAKLKLTTDSIEKTQLIYLKEKLDLMEMPSFETPIRDRSQPLIGNLVVVDIGNKLGMGCNFYGAFVYGRDFIPLFFKEMLDAEGTKAVVAALLANGLEPKIPDVHPIL